MAYAIKTYTFSEPVRSFEDVPYKRGPSHFSFSDAKEQIIYLDDDDNRYSRAVVIFRALDRPEGQLTGQELLVDINLSGVHFPAGEMLSLPGDGIAIITDFDTRENRYYAFFPKRLGKYTTDVDTVGDNTSVMIIPKNPQTPEFDPSLNYYYSGQAGVNGDASRLDIQVAPTQIPPGYLKSFCFASGSMITTAQGVRPIETLKAGDLVKTCDHGIKPLSWIGKRRFSQRQLDISPNLIPICIRAGALAPGIPSHDLTLSPQHRVLVKSRIAEHLTGTQETLIAAKHLTSFPGIDAITPLNGIEYYHLLFDHHELVFTHGCWTESLYTGEQALKSISPSGQREIRAIFPELFADDAQSRPGARRFMSGGEARELTRRHIKNSKPLFMKTD